MFHHESWRPIYFEVTVKRHKNIAGMDHGAGFFYSYCYNLYLMSFAAAVNTSATASSAVCFIFV